jgi:hypothetical protein
VPGSEVEGFPGRKSTLQLRGRSQADVLHSPAFILKSSEDTLPLGLALLISMRGFVHCLEHVQPGAQGMSHPPGVLGHPDIHARVAHSRPHLSGTIVQNRGH